MPSLSLSSAAGVASGAEAAGGNRKSGSGWNATEDGFLRREICEGLNPVETGHVLLDGSD